MTIATTPTLHNPPPGTAPWQAAIERLHAALRSADYHLCQWTPCSYHPLAAAFECANLWRFLAHRRHQFMEPSAVPSMYRRLGRLRRPVVESALSFFGLSESQPEPVVRQLLADLGAPASVEELLELEIIRRLENGQLRSQIRFVPWGKTILVSDTYDRNIADFTWIGRDTFRLAERLTSLIAGRRFKRGLDICCGTGVHALTLSRYTDQVEGADINPRAVAYATLNAQLEGVQDRVRFVQGDLGSQMQGPYDILVSNAPFVFMEPTEGSGNRDGYGGNFGMELTLRVVEDLDRLLGPTGEAHFQAMSPVINGKSLVQDEIEKRLAGRGLGARVFYEQYLFDWERWRFHQQFGISYIILSYVQVSRTFPPGVQTINLPPLSRLANRLYVQLSNLRAK